MKLRSNLSVLILATLCTFSLADPPPHSHGGGGEDPPKQAYFLTLLGGFVPGERAKAMEINESGVIVGWAELDRRDRRAFYVIPDTNENYGPLIDINVVAKLLNGGVIATNANDVNKYGEVVGTAETVFGRRVFVFDIDTTTFTILPAVEQDWVDNPKNNDAGDIIARGSHNVMLYRADGVTFELDAEDVIGQGSDGFLGRVDINERDEDGNMQIVTGSGQRMTLSSQTPAGSDPVLGEIQTWPDFQLSMTTINDFGEFGGWMGGISGKPKPKEPVGGFLFCPELDDEPRKLLDGNFSFPTDINSTGDACASTWLHHQTLADGEVLSIIKHLNILNYTGPSGFDSQAVSERYGGTDFPRIVGAAVGGDIQGAFLLTPVDMP